MGTILIIDDDKDLVEAYRLVLGAHGHKAQAAYSAQQAREFLKVSRPDAVILDVMMETKDSGFELAREVHEQFSDLPIIMITAIHRAVGASFHFEPDETWLPVVTFLDKPVDPAVLAEKVNAVLGE